MLSTWQDTTFLDSASKEHCSENGTEEEKVVDSKVLFVVLHFSAAWSISHSIYQMCSLYSMLLEKFDFSLFPTTDAEPQLGATKKTQFEGLLLLVL